MLPSKKRLKRIKKKQSSKALISVSESRVLRRRIALLRVSGLTATDIAKSLTGVTRGKVRKILDEPETQRVIAGLENDLNEAMETRYKNLLVKAIDRIGDLVDNSGDDVALHAIEMIMKMNGKLADGSRASQAMEAMMNNGGGMVGAFAMPADKVQSAMDYLDVTREKEVKAD